MFKKIKRTALLLMSLVFLLAYVGVFAVPNPIKKSYANDFVGVLSEDTKKYIIDNSVALCDKTKAQVVVMIVDSLEGKSVEDYSLEVIRSWGIGDNQMNNGVLVLLAINDRKVKIDVGYGLEGRINDSKAGRFLDEYAAPYFKNDDWDTGIKTLYSALLKEVYEEYNAEVPSEVSSIVSEVSDSGSDLGMTIAVILVVIVIGCVLIPLSRRSGRHFGDDGETFGGFYDGGDFGGFYGGGGSDGGGFGDFFGGGGSAGGGGASRSF